MGNNRIRKAGFLNQNFLRASNPRKTFFAPVPKLFLQQYRHKADMGIAVSNVRFRGHNGQDADVRELAEENFL
jgi:hypothetical protein